VTLVNGKEIFTGSLPGPEARIASQHGVVLVDGWSVATVGADAFTWSSGDASGQVQLAPATPEDITWLQAHEPDLLAALMARTVTPDVSLTCSKDRCHADKSAVDTSWLTSPEKVPGLGPVYKGWKVTNLLWLATFDIPSSAEDVTFTVRSGSSVVLRTIAGALDGSDPVGYNGFLSNSWLLSAAFDRVFPTSPDWLGGDGSRTVPDTLNGDVPPAALASAAAATAALASVDGLSAPWTTAHGFNDGQLTYYSSPTTGCGSGALCVPSSVQTRVKPGKSYSTLVCTDGASAAVVGRTYNTATALDGPILQFGVDGFVPRDDLSGAPLLDGATELRWSTLLLLTGPDASPVVVAGQVGSSAVSDPSDLLPQVHFYGKPWRACSH